MVVDEDTVRRVRSRRALEDLIAAIESEQTSRPDWIHLQSQARLDRIEPEAWPGLLTSLHRSVRRGFRTAPIHLDGPDEFLDAWRCIARHGFHDFGEAGWSKCYDSTVAEDYDYLAAYLEGGLDALDPYAVYSAVLGSHDFGVEDFLCSPRFRDVTTLIEPMAGTAEFLYQGHFAFPQLQYLMIDLDEAARDRVTARPWLPDTHWQYYASDVLDEEVWKQVKATRRGPALAFVGKQSHQLFDPRQLCQLLEFGTRYAESLILETPAMSLVGDIDSEEDMTRPEMEAAGLSVALHDIPGTRPNPFTNQLSFRLEARDETGQRTLFEYANWTVFSQPTLVVLAQLLDLDAWYYHSAIEEFVPVQHDASETDCHENVNFMLFSRKGL